MNMNTKLCIASLFSFLILYGDCNVLQSFNGEEVNSCYFHYLCDLHETDKMYQLLEESTDKVKVKFWEAMKEVFDISGGQPWEDFEMYRVTVCNYTDERRKAAFNELASLSFEYALVSCMNLFSKVCRATDDFLMRASAYAKEIMQSDECKLHGSKFQ